MRAYLVVLLLAGCATQSEMVWVKDGSTRESFNADTGQCRAQAMSVPGALTYAATQAAVVFQSCMAGKGWELRPQQEPGSAETNPNYRVVR